MTYKKNWIRLAAAPVFVVGIGLVGSVGCSDVADIVEGCDEFSASADWGADLEIALEVKTFMGASGSLVTVADQMLADVNEACEGIATATKRDGRCSKHSRTPIPRCETRPSGRSCRGTSGISLATRSVLPPPTC